MRKRITLLDQKNQLLDRIILDQSWI